jgi:flavorubredoxin
MKPFEIIRGVHWIGAAHPELRIFDDLLPTRRGTTYNSYLVRGEKSAVIDTVKAIKADEFMENLKSLIDPRKLDVIVVNHAEPDHAGSLARLMEAAPQARVYSSKAARLYLRDLFGRAIETLSVEEHTEVALGGRVLRFIPAPFLHWPDTVFTWLPEERILFPCDAFGAHCCDERMYDNLVPDLETDFRIYFDVLMRPYRDKVLAAIERIAELDPALICPSHGPILRVNPKQYPERYRQWATTPEVLKPCIGVLYASAHGNTRLMAEAIVEGMRPLDVIVDVVHVTEVDDSRVRAVLESADGLLFGMPTIVRDIPGPMWRALGLLSTVKVRAKKAAAFGSFGWSGEAVGMVEQRLKDMRIPVTPSGLRFKFKPTAADLDRCRAFGGNFAAEVSAG